ncbi:MAG: serine hydrolase [Cyclobacteriaceae bacterium]|nr:serine hydrolase [Cyclobacteriaceae bacterium]
MPLFSFNYKANGSAGKKVWLISVLLITGIFQAFGQTDREKWVDSVFQLLPFEAKIGQLIMMPVDAYADEAAVEKLLGQISNYGIGGVVVTRGGPVVQKQLLKQLSEKSAIPLLIGLNAEEGLGSTLDSTLVFPQTLMLGAIQDDSLLFYYGKEVGRQLKALGVHITFAPTADLSSTFQTDEMVNHTFGENPERVANAAVLYMKGLQRAGIIPVAKHYPHYGLKVTGYTKGDPVMGLAQDDKQSLFPLKQLIDNGCPAILASYTHDPIFPDRRKIVQNKKRIIPEALPTLYIADYLKKNFTFDGLVFSYVPDVKIILRKYQPGDSEIYAFLAGNDILLFPQNIAATVRKLRKQIKKNPALQNQLDARVKKVLTFKYDVRGQEITSPDEENLLLQLNTLEASVLRQDLYEKSVSIVSDEQQALPIKIIENTSFASLSIGERKENEFSNYLSHYAPFDHFQFHQPDEDADELLEELKKYDVVIAGIFLTSSGLTTRYPALLDSLTKYTNVIVCNFGPPSRFSLFSQPATLVQAFVDLGLMRRTVPQILFGGLESTGKLPLSVTEQLKEGSGVRTSSLGRLSYTIPEAVGMSSQSLDKISAIVREAIDMQAAPGCQVLIAKNGKVIYNKSFGWYTYDNQQPVTDETLYDIASMTKVLGTLQSVMFLYDRGLIDLNYKMSYYLPELRSTNKKDITLKDVLAHQAGLLAFIPLWPQTMKNDKEFLPYYYSKTRDPKYSLQVSPNLFAAPIIRDSLWKWTFESRMIEKPARTPYTLRYSDIGFWLLHRLSERMLNQPIDDFLWQNVYEPLGAYSTGYVPLNRYPLARITPTEYDKIFRKEMIHGTVHDERAAMMGGVAGHAGLFSTAHDVAKLGQMILQKGYYGGHQYFKPETVELFTAKQFENSRRGLGWDKPIQSDWATPTSLFSSPRTFGHTGFTGTCIWIDPEFELVYVFLSNRVYPDRSTKLITTNIRSRIQDIIYQSIFDFCQYPNPFSWSRSR